MKLKSSSKALLQYNYLLNIIDYLDETQSAKEHIIAYTNKLIDVMAEDFEEQKKKIKVAKHLQIGDVFYTIDGLKVYCFKVRAIALQPDDEILYNWKYRASDVYTNLNDVVDALQKQSDAMIEKIKSDLKGGE